MDVLPLKEVQSEARQVPQVLAQLRVGLPWGFSADSRLTAIVVKNELEIGIAWNARLGKLWVSAFDHHGFFYGAVGVQGFDATSWGWLNKPGPFVQSGVRKRRKKVTILQNLPSETSGGDSVVGTVGRGTAGPCRGRSATYGPTFTSISSRSSPGTPIRSGKPKVPVPRWA